MPRKSKSPRTASERSIAHRARKVAGGYRPKSFLLAPDACAQLAALAQAEGIGEARVLERLIRTAADVLASDLGIP
jgi:hypothetical protein